MSSKNKESSNLSNGSESSDNGYYHVELPIFNLRSSFSQSQYGLKPEEWYQNRLSQSYKRIHQKEFDKIKKGSKKKSR